MRVRVRPLLGNILRDPVTRLPLPAEGKVVTINSFWQRRLDAGDVEMVEGKEDSGLPEPVDENVHLEDELKSKKKKKK
jgi:hypothetical protein